MFVYILRVSAVKLVKATYYMIKEIKFISSLAVGDLKHLDMLAKNFFLEWITWIKEHKMLNELSAPCT